MSFIKKNTAFWVLSAGVLLIAFLFLSLYFPTSNDNKLTILLPGTADNDIGISIVPIGQNHKIVESIEITSSNVQNVIESLQRPTEYSFQAKSQLFYSAGNSVTTIGFACKGDMKRTEQYIGSGEIKVSILTPPTIYIWSRENNIVYKGLAADFTGDDMALMPTYESIMAYKQADILSCEMGEYISNACIIVRCLNNLTENEEVFYISVDAGLLLKAETYENGELVYKYEVTGFSLETVDADTFVIPGAK